MKSQRVSLIGLVVLGLAAQLVISAPSLYSDATNSGNSSSTHDTTNNRSKFVKESVEGQQDRLSTLPPEILKQIVGPLVTDESIFELMEVSKFLRSFIFNHFEKEYILRLYATISSFSRCKFIYHWAQGDREMFSSAWLRVLRQHYYAESYKLSPINRIGNPASSDTRHTIPISKNHRNYLEHNQDDPILQPNAWWYVNPKKLQMRPLAYQFPLLALVDNLGDGQKVAEAIKLFTNQEAIFGLNSGLKGPEKTRIFNLAGIYAFKQGFPRTKALHWDLRRSLAVIAMARLAVTGRFTDLADFMKEMAIVYNNGTGNIDNKCFYYYLNRMAIVLASMFQLESDLDNYLNVYDEELQWMDNSYADEFEIMPLANPIIFRDFARCHLVSNIRKSGLLNAAEFLASKWNCKVAPEVSPVELDAQPERGNIREWMDPDLIKTYYRILRGIELHLPNLLKLTNDNQMGVMALVSEFEPSEKARVSDLGPWSTNKEKIRRVYSAMDPAIYNELTGPEARESKYFLGEY
ncbi:hypothetical protein BJ085DRAFT_30556 [Dimargaris cristalligena]|uniref:F-box domain-containing protein n=1 Tax=Dimargaris cristalligena TaxID=215637 RepID=A0A4Q0A1T9_9FUNG|nr:hypothetical protein BJ085DRAFT_30556 [Dimargaris cristalligena]|eukprot:RKP40053.1 hypothetical protein BJ085DRAFT_30556 [Dimargaris cristalligena]